MYEDTLQRAVRELKEQMTPEELRQNIEMGENMYKNLDPDELNNNIADEVGLLVEKIKSGLDFEDLDDNDIKILTDYYGNDYEVKINEAIDKCLSNVEEQSALQFLYLDDLPKTTDMIFKYAFVLKKFPYMGLQMDDPQYLACKYYHSIYTLFKPLVNMKPLSDDIEFLVHMQCSKSHDIEKTLTDMREKDSVSFSTIIEFFIRGKFDWVLEDIPKCTNVLLIERLYFELIVEFLTQTDQDAVNNMETIITNYYNMFMSKSPEWANSKFTKNELYFLAFRIGYHIYKNFDATTTKISPTRFTTLLEYLQTIAATDDPQESELSGDTDFDKIWIKQRIHNCKNVSGCRLYFRN
jgi:hypothetical protein